MEGKMAFRYTMAAVAIGAATAITASPGWAQPQPGRSGDGSPPRATARIADLSPEGVAISGRVAEVYGNKFVLQDESGRVLVETGPRWYRAFEPRQGERLTVLGRPEEGSFEAYSVVREGGERVEIRRPAGPPPWAGGPGRGARGPEGRGGPPDRRAEMGLGEAEARRMLEQAGYRDVGALERKARHYEAEAVNPRGERVEVHVGEDGEIRRERVRHGDDGRLATRLPDREVGRLAERYGFRVDGRIRRDDDRVEFEARDPRGDRFEVTLDADGRLREVERSDPG